MNKMTLIDKIAGDTGMTKTAAAEVLDSLLDGITAALRENQRVTLSGFGSWNVRHSKPRTGRNPQTGAEISIGARRAVRFRSGKQLAETLNS
jgi:DNA-binding protein HU-beta